MSDSSDSKKIEALEKRVADLEKQLADTSQTAGGFNGNLDIKSVK